MTGQHTPAPESVARAYQQRLVPALFEEWAPRLVAAAEIQPGQRVLDVACGTGILARTVARRAGSGSLVSAVDLNPAMLTVGRELSPEIDWREGPAEDLPFDDALFDAVVSQFGLMFFPSPESALEEMMRVLKPGGHLAVAVFGSLDSLPAYAAIADVYERQVNKAVGDALRLPFSMGDTRKLASCCTAAGIDTADITPHEGRAYFPGTREMVLADVEGWFPFAEISLDDQTLEAVVDEADKVLAPFRTEQGAITFPVPVHIIAATKT